MQQNTIKQDKSIQQQKNRYTRKRDGQSNPYRFAEKLD